MSTAAQIAANQANAQKSTGPTSEQGRAASSQNNFRHGFRGKFALVDGEDAAEFKTLLTDLQLEHQPQTVTEQILVQSMAEHHWLARRARRFQDVFVVRDMNAPETMRAMSLWMRYENQHERGFMKCLAELRKSRQERRKMEIGFERQKQNEAAEVRKTEAHEVKQRLTLAKARLHELDHDIKSMLQAPLPGHTTFKFEDLKAAIQQSLTQCAMQNAA